MDEEFFRIKISEILCNYDEVLTRVGKEEITNRKLYLLTTSLGEKR